MTFISFLQPHILKDLYSISSFQILCCRNCHRHLSGLECVTPTHPPLPPKEDKCHFSRMLPEDFLRLSWGLSFCSPLIRYTKTWFSNPSLSPSSPTPFCFVPQNNTMLYPVDPAVIPFRSVCETTTFMNISTIWYKEGNLPHQKYTICIIFLIKITRCQTKQSVLIRWVEAEKIKSTLEAFFLLLFWKEYAFINNLNIELVA